MSVVLFCLVSSGPANKVHHISGVPGYAEGGESVSYSDESVFVTERVGVVSSNIGKSSFMVPLTFHTEHSPVIRTQLDTGATCSALLYTDLLNILQSGEIELDPPGGKIRLYDGRVVEPLRSYTFTVSLNSGSECKISFDIFDKRPLVHRRWQHVHQTRQCGPVVRALALRSGDPRFKTW